MRTLIVTIIGRPNVGKSTLFNALVKKRIAIVDDVAGTTRDRVSSMITYNGYKVELIDTGGMGLDPKNKTEDARLWPQIQKQITYAILKSDII
ncbi:MAG: GTPase, partial [Planctomycetota bacterium]